MEDVMKAATQLNNTLLESVEYKSYLAAHEKLHAFPEYREMADGFRKKQVAHEIQKRNGETPEIDELSLSNDYADICLITVINDFFQAEIQLLSLIKAVYGEVCRGLLIEM